MEPVLDAVQEAKQVILTQHEIYKLAIAFMFGSLTSAVWTWKEGKKARAHEVFSTAVVSGFGAIVWACILNQYNLPTTLLIAVSILTGFSGDIMLRGMVKGAVKIAETVFSPTVLQIFGIPSANKKTTKVQTHERNEDNKA